MDYSWTLLNTAEYYKVLCSYIYSRNDVVYDIFEIMHVRLEKMADFNGLRSYMEAYLSPKFQDKIERKRVEFIALVDTDLDKMDDATQVAVDAFYARMKLWDSIVIELKKSYLNQFV